MYGINLAQKLWDNFYIYIYIFTNLLLSYFTFYTKDKHLMNTSFIFNNIEL